MKKVSVTLITDDDKEITVAFEGGFEVRLDYDLNLGSVYSLSPVPQGPAKLDLLLTAKGPVNLDASPGINVLKSLS